MRIAIYSRKSVYTGKGDSIENQIEMCRQYIRDKIDPEETAEIFVYEDEGFSGKNILRPQFTKMLKDMEERPFDYIVCYRLDRISRNVGDFAALIENLNHRDIAFVCIKEEFDTSTPLGKAMMYIASVFAQLERETIAERVRDNMQMLARTGRWLGGTAPTGFQAEKAMEMLIDGKIRAVSKLIQDEEEIAVVRLIFAQYAQTQSLSAVGKQLAAKGIRSRSGALFSLVGIRDILQNPVYCIADRDAYRYFLQCHADLCFEETDCSNRLGLLSYNKRDYKKKNAPRRSEENWIIAIGRHCGIVSGKEWAAVQKTLAANRPAIAAPARTSNAYALLSGRIFCGGCGRRYFAKKRNGSRRFDYICQSKTQGGKALCNGKNLSGIATDAAVFTALLLYVTIDVKLIDELIKAKKTLAASMEWETPVTGTEAKATRYHREIDQLLAVLADGGNEEAVVRRIKERIVLLDQELRELTAAGKVQQEAEQTKANVQSLAASLANPTTFFNSGSIYERRALVRLLIKSIRWDGQTLSMYLHI